MVFKKDLTPIGGKRGVVTKHRGKGSTMQRVPPGGRESLTGASPLNQMTGRFPKALPPAPAPAAPAGPPGPPGPPGAMPPFGAGEPE